MNKYENLNEIKEHMYIHTEVIVAEDYIMKKISVWQEARKRPDCKALLHASRCREAIVENWTGLDLLLRVKNFEISLQMILPLIWILVKLGHKALAWNRESKVLTRHTQIIADQYDDDITAAVLI